MSYELGCRIVCTVFLIGISYGSAPFVCFSWRVEILSLAVRLP